MKRVLATLLVWVFSRSAAHADETLLLFEQAGLRPGLCAALRIQLTDVATVRCHTDDAASAAIDVRLHRASARVALEGARLGVLLERDADAGRLRMLVVGARPDRALLAVEPTEARPEPDIDRTLALKVRETFETSVPTESPTLQPVVSAHPGSARWQALLELGGELGLGRQTRPGGRVALGLRRARDAHWGELALVARLLADTHASDESGRVREEQGSLHASLRTGWLRGRFAFGPAFELGVAHSRALGETRDGRRGSARLALFRVGLAFDLRVSLWRGVQLRFAPGIELDPVAREFALDGRDVLALGRVRALLPLGLVVALGGPG